MKGYRFMIDTETSGLKNKKEQIYTMAVLVVDESNDQIVERVEYRILPKKGVFPSVKALEVNKLKVFSNEYKKSAMTENEAIEHFVNLSNKYVVANGNDIIKPKLGSYNIPFDDFFTSVAMSRAGHKTNDHFNKSRIDPLPTARKLRDQKKLLKKGESFSSASLGSIAEAFEIPFKNDAHTCMADAEKAEEVYKKLVELDTGKKPCELKVNPSFFNDGDIYNITTNSAKSGLKERHIKVLHNDQDSNKIVALDLDDINKNKKFKESAIREFNYGTIIDETIPVDSEMDRLEEIYNKNKEEIEKLTEAKIGNIDKKTKKEGDVEFDADVSSFELICGVEGILSNKEMTLPEVEEVLSNQGIDPRSVSAIFTKANELNLAKGGNGILPVNKIELQKELDALKNDLHNYLLSVNLADINDSDEAIISYFEHMSKEYPENFNDISSEEIKKRFNLNTAKETQTPIVSNKVSSKCTICGRAITNEQSHLNGAGKVCLETMGKHMKKAS